MNFITRHDGLLLINGGDDLVEPESEIIYVSVQPKENKKGKLHRDNSHIHLVLPPIEEIDTYICLDHNYRLICHHVIYTSVSM